MLGLLDRATKMTVHKVHPCARTFYLRTEVRELQRTLIVGYTGDTKPPALARVCNRAAMFPSQIDHRHGSALHRT